MYANIKKNIEALNAPETVNRSLTFFALCDTKNRAEDIMHKDLYLKV